MTVSPQPTASPADDADAGVSVRVFGRTDVGQVRDHNEDTFLVASLDGTAPIAFHESPVELTVGAHGVVLLVADGMGGAASGELASSMAANAVFDALRVQWSASDITTSDNFTMALRDAATLANAQVHTFSREHPEHRGMGTTATIAGVLGDTLFVAQVGDSRAYLIRGANARQLTKDQSLIQRLVEAGELTEAQAEASERRNIILQALGPEAQITIDLTYQSLRRGDVLLMCSDGLSGLVRADEIARLSQSSGSVTALCDALIALANERGGPDNITAVAAQFTGRALPAAREGDVLGYQTYSLAGTLNHDTAETPAEPMVLRRGLRSDPTPRYGTPAPTAAAIADEIERAQAGAAKPNVHATTNANDGDVADVTRDLPRNAPGDAAPTSTPLGAPSAEVRERRQRVEPLFFALAAIAAIGAIFWVVQLMRG